MPPRTKILRLLILLAALAQGCAGVKPYQRTYLNDDNMQLGRRPLDKFDENAHSYREGSTGGGGSKASGGCGCN